MSTSKQRKAPVCCDEVKLRHTTHWDWEMASHAELAAAYGQGAQKLRRARWRRASLLVSGVATACGLGWLLLS
nr:hypothetical protein [Oceanococcus sp. HetDA_MAG_MS8]